MTIGEHQIDNTCLAVEPVGRVHCAGSETASKSYGAMDGAVRPGGAGVRRDLASVRLIRALDIWSREIRSGVTGPPYGAWPSGRAPGPEPTPSFSRRNVSV